LSGVALVTGGAGFIGSHLVEQLISDFDVHVVDDLSRGRRDWLPAEAVLHEADVRDQDRLTRIVEGVRPRVAVHLAAMHFIPAVDSAPRQAREVNVRGSANLLRSLASTSPAVVLFASSAAVYPDVSGPIPESTQPSPIDVYGETKLDGERLFADFAASTGARCLVARIFNVIGARETNRHVVPELISQLRAGAAMVELGNLTTCRDYTDVRDVAWALARLVSEPPKEHSTLNVGSGATVSVGELVETCEKILGRPIAVEVESSRLRRQDRMELTADIRRLVSAVGPFPIRSLEETLGELLGPEGQG
jgi:UDP-glucose 4-epimerase